MKMIIYISKDIGNLKRMEIGQSLARGKLLSVLMLVSYWLQYCGCGPSLEIRAVIWSGFLLFFVCLIYYWTS